MGSQMSVCSSISTMMWQTRNDLSEIPYVRSTNKKGSSLFATKLAQRSPSSQQERARKGRHAKIAPSGKAQLTYACPPLTSAKRKEGTSGMGKASISALNSIQGPS